MIQQWLANHIPSHHKRSSHSVLGFDIESIAKAPFMPERELLPDGPATVQLATPNSCLIVPLTLCGDGSAQYAPAALRNVINHTNVIKVGVEVDWDAIELYRWSKLSIRDGNSCGSQIDGEHSSHQLTDEQNEHKQREPSILWEMTSRFDIGCILPDSTPHRTAGTKEIARRVIGVNIPKNTNLSMSNWGLKQLSSEQIAYAARDAWVGAAVVQKLEESSSFTIDKLMEMQFMKRQRSVQDIEVRSLKRKRVRAELKRKSFLEKKERGRYEKRIKELKDKLQLLSPDRPPLIEDCDFVLILMNQIRTIHYLI